MKLSGEALAAILVCFQKCLVEGVEFLDILEELEFDVSSGEIVPTNQDEVAGTINFDLNVSYEQEDETIANSIIIP